MSVLNQIQTLEFQLEIPSRKHNKDIQDKIVSLFHYRLQAMLDELLAPYSDAHSDIGFEHIELSLDPIPLDVLEDELLEKTEAALRSYFETAFKQLYRHPKPVTQAPPIAANAKQPYSVTKTATLTYFLTYGHYPWWEKEMNIPLSQRWMSALQEEKKTFTAQLFIAGRKSYAVKRMAHQLTEDALEKTISVIEPGGAKSIFSFHEHLKEQHREKPISAGLTGSDFSKTIWEFTLTYLFMEMGSVFNQKMYLKSQVKQIAQRYNTTYQNVLNFLNRGLKQIAENDIKKRTLFLNLAALGRDLSSEKKPIKTNPFEDDLVFSVRTLLRKTTYTKKDRSTMARHIAQLQKREQDRKKLSGTLTSGEFYRLTAFIIPREKDFIKEYLLKTEHSYKENPIPGGSRDDFMISVRGLVLTYLLIENTTVFNRKMFLKNQIKQIGQHYNIENHKVLQFLVYGFRDIKTLNPDKAALFGILKTLMDETGSPAAKTFAKPAAKRRNEPDMALLRSLLSLQNLSEKEHKLLLSILKGYRKNRDTELTALAETELLQLLRHLVPGHRFFVRQYAEHIALLHSKVFATPSTSAFKQQVWHFIIQNLAGRDSQFSPKIFMEEQLKKLASHFTVEYIAILFHFMEAMDTVQGARGISELKDTVAALYLEHHVNPAVFRKIAEKTDFSAFIPQMVHFLQFGAYSPRDPYIGKPVLVQVFRELLLNYKEKLLSALKTNGLIALRNPPLLGLAFFPEDLVSVWEAFKKEHFGAGAGVETDAAIPANAARCQNILLFYLETGSLPWWSGKLSLKEIITYMLARPEMFRSFIQSREWTPAPAKRLYNLLDAGEKETFLHIVTDAELIKTGTTINKMLNHIGKSIGHATLDEAFLLFALQHTKRSLSPGAFAVEYLRQFSEENNLSYDALIMQSSAYLKAHRAEKAISLFEKEKESARSKADMQLRKRLLRSYQTKERPKAELGALSEFIKKQDKNKLVQQLAGLTARKKTPGIPVFKLLLKYLHEKDRAVIQFFSEIEQLTKITAIRTAFPGLYEDVLRFYMEYIGIKKIAAFNFNEFMLRWFAYMESKNKDKALQLMKLIEKHPLKNSVWLSRFVAYTSALSPAPESDPVEKEVLLEELPHIDDMETAELQPDSLTEKVLVFNSGLVLLWPFLSHCFKTLQYTNGTEFTSPGMQERAIYLLHYAATGHCEDTGEEHLVINKILCGFPVTQPLSTAMKLTGREKELTESMLKAVIAQWSKIGNTSVDGLRGSYIIREGYLEEEENGYQMQIEKKGYDLLLDYLPWKLELIKLPWMDKPLYVSWRQ